MFGETRVRPEQVPPGRRWVPECRQLRGVRPGPTGWVSVLCTVVALSGASGCGTNVEALLAQTGNAAVTTVLDLLLTNFANSVADAFDAADQPRDADNDNGDDEDDEDDGGGDGAAVFAANCASCHGDDGASGFAPDVTGLAADAVAEGLELATHGSISLTEAEISAIADFLGGGGGLENGGTTGAPTAGEPIFASLGCAACHCADAIGGCALEAPSLVGVGSATLDELLRGDAAHPGGKFDLDDQGIADLAAFLASP